jgi:hypothetical protein
MTGFFGAFAAGFEAFAAGFAFTAGDFLVAGMLTHPVND